MAGSIRVLAPGGQERLENIVNQRIWSADRDR